MRISFKIILLFAILVSITSSVSGSVSELIISPENPVVGEEITLKGKASPNEVLYPSIIFKETVDVAEDNKYEYQINGIVIPPGKNSFAVTAENVKNLNVGIKLLAWWTKGTDAANGVATVSQGNVPGGTYNIKIFGVSSDTASFVNLTIKAASKITADGEGHFEYRYSTSNLPAGIYTLNIGDKNRTIKLLAKKEKTDKEGSENLEIKNTPVPVITGKKDESLFNRFMRLLGL